MEERTFRTLSKKCAVNEARSRLFEGLMSRKLGLKEIEESVQHEEGKFKGGNKFNFERRRKIVHLFMDEKSRDNWKEGVILRKARENSRRDLSKALGPKSRKFRGIVRDVGTYIAKLRLSLAHRNTKKINHLSRKYSKKEIDLSEEESRIYGEAEIFLDSCKMVAEASKKPVIVCMEGEKICLSKEEIEVLSLGPKFCLQNDLKEDEFENEVEQMLIKAKWDLLGEEKEEKNRDRIWEGALSAIFSEEENLENEEETKMKEGLSRMPHNFEDNSFNYGRRKVTDTKGNSRVYLPKQGQNLDLEARLEMVRMQLLGAYRAYTREKCEPVRGSAPGEGSEDISKGSRQKTNLTRAAMRGLKSLKKRVKEGSLVVLPTDKSGRFAVMSRETYLKAGTKHTAKDELVGSEQISRTQAVLNGSVSMLIKFFQVGKEWDHVGRMRETMLNESLAICPLYLTMKDHKGWVMESGKVPPTRPIAGGNAGMNIHLSELLSGVLEPVADQFRDGNEVISTEDFVARLVEYNQKVAGWSLGGWWDGKLDAEGKFVACGNCLGDLTRAYDAEDPELCVCQVPEQAGGPAQCPGRSEGGLAEEGHEGRVNCTCVGPETTLEDPELCEEVRDRLGLGLCLGLENETTQAKQMKKETTTKGPPTRTTINYVRQKRLADWKEEVRAGSNKASTAPPEVIQAIDERVVIVGMDVEALYPSLLVKEIKKLVYEGVMESSLSWQGVDYREGLRFIALNWSKEKCLASELRKFLPRRKKSKGRRPGVTGKDAMGAEVGSEEQWRFPDVPMSEEDKKKVVATVIMVATEVLFTNHLYSFGGDVFRQVEGGPIGLRATCAVARLVMCLWDRRWKECLARSGINLGLYARYMDDGRAVLHSIMPGWRWVEGELHYSPSWVEEDNKLTATERTRKVLHASMQGVVNCLSFTTETAEQFEDNCLPTLDISLWVEEDWQVSWKFFEKPTTTNVTVQKTSAMEENSKMQILANDLVRRLRNTMRSLDKSYKRQVVEQYSQKLLNSGYARDQVIKIVVAGIRGYERQVKRCAVEGRPLYRTAKQSSAGRFRKKVLGKSEWFRTKRKKEEEAGSYPELQGSSKQPQAQYRGRYRGQMQAGGAVKTRTVLFVEHTPCGELASRLRDLLKRTEPALGFRIKVVERAGMPLARQFPLTNLFGGAPCGRETCVTCQQGGENLPQCTKRNLVYENVCLRCHPEAGEGKEPKAGLTTVPAIYTGETCRSLAERGAEHWSAYRAGSEGSHILKHHMVHHGGQGEPKFHLRPVKYFKTPLARQVYEAVRIRRRGGEGNLLNSRSEYNRCKITRLSLPQTNPVPTASAPASQVPTEKENCQEEAETATDVTALELDLLTKKDQIDEEARTARKWQVTRTSPSKRSGTAVERARKLPKLEAKLPVAESGQPGIKKFLTKPTCQAGDQPTNVASMFAAQVELPGKGQSDANCQDSATALPPDGTASPGRQAAPANLPEDEMNLPGWVLDQLGTQLTEADLNQRVEPASAPITLVQEKVCREGCQKPTDEREEGGGGDVGRVVQECVQNLLDKKCSIHKTDFKTVKTRIRSWVKCKNGLFRNVYKSKETLVCLGVSQKSPSRKTLLPNSGGKQIESSPDSTLGVRTFAVKRKSRKPD